MINKKYQKKKTFPAASAAEEKHSTVVCEDIENEGISEGGNSTLNFDESDKDEQNKRERIRQLDNPHSIMQE
jgi:hypothetical protein